MKMISKHKLTLMWLLVLCFLFTPQLSAANLENLEELEAFFDGALSIQIKDLKIPGAAVALVKDGEIAFSKGYGFANLENKTAMDPLSSLHRTGSNSKILIWTAVMQLVEQEKLDLYTDINTYLDFSIPSKISGREAPPITMHHLLTHTAAFEDEVIGLFTSEADQLLPLGEYVKKHFPGRIFQPGATLAYSNYGATLAAYIVELVSGIPFNQYVQDHILTPIGMHFTTFEQPLSRYLALQLSQGYRYVAGAFIAGDFEYIKSYPAGALSTTVHDMALLMIAHLNLVQPEIEIDLPEEEEEELTAEETIEIDEADEVVVPPTPLLQKETAKLMQSQQFAAHPELSGMTYGFIEADYNGYNVLSHGGDTILFTTGLYFLPHENVGLYVVYNSPVGEMARLALFQSFMDHYFPDLDAKHVRPQPITTETEKHYNGTFHPARSNFSGIESILRLAQPLYLNLNEENYLALTFQGRTSLFGEIAPNLFQELHGSDRIAFGVSNNQINKIHFAGPSTWLRTPFYETPIFIISLLGISVLFFLVTILGWIRGIFKSQIRRHRFVAPKVLGVLFFLIFITIGILFVDLVTTTDPILGIPSIVLESSPTLNAILVLAKILIGLAALMLLTAIYVIASKKGSRWQRFHFTLLSLSSLSIIMILYQMNLF